MTEETDLSAEIKRGRRFVRKQRHGEGSVIGLPLDADAWKNGMSYGSMLIEDWSPFV